MQPREFEEFARRFWTEAFKAHGAEQKGAVDRLAKATLGLAFGEGLQFDSEAEPVKLKNVGALVFSLACYVLSAAALAKMAGMI